METKEYQLNKLNRLIRFLKNAGYFKICNDESLFEQWFQSLTFEQFENVLIHLNILLRNDKISDKGFFENYMFVDSGSSMLDLISPTNEIQHEILIKLLDNLKTLNNNKERALLTYYTLLNLHLFKDGNGRVSRLVFDLFYNVGNFNIDQMTENINWYIHNNQNERILDKSDTNNIIENNSFEHCRNIPSIADVNFDMGVQNYNYFFHSNNSFNKEDWKIVRTYYSLTDEDLNFLPYDIKEQLNDKELNELKLLLMDNNGNTHYSIGGLIMLYVTLKNGTFSEWKKTSDKMNEFLIERHMLSGNIRLIFSLINNKDLFKSWNLEDYKTALDFGRKLKRSEFNWLFEWFINPNDNQYQDTAVVEYLQSEGHNFSI